MKRLLVILGLIGCCFLVLAGCGEPEADVNVFMMPTNGMSERASEHLQQSLQAGLGDQLQAKLIVAFMYSIEKLSIEVAGASNGIFIIPEEPFKMMVRDGGAVDLSDEYNKDDYPAAVSDGKLYAIPLSGTPWLQDIEYKGEELFAFIPVNAPDIEKSKQVLKAIAGK